MVPTNGSKGPSPRMKPIDPATKEALLLLFSPNGSFVQDLLLTEVQTYICAFLLWFSGSQLLPSNQVLVFINKTILYFCSLFVQLMPYLGGH